METLLVTVDEKEDFEVEFSGSTYEDLLKAIREELPPDLLSPGQDIAHLQIFSEKFSKFVRLNPKKVETTVKDGSQLKVTLTATGPAPPATSDPPVTPAKPSAINPDTGGTGSDTGGTGSDMGGTGSDTGSTGSDKGGTGSDTGATSSDKAPTNAEPPKETPGEGTDGPQESDKENTNDDKEASEFPICSSAPDDTPADAVVDNPEGAGGAYVSKEKIWKGMDKLKVYFMNADDIDKWGWKCRGEPMNINTVIAWARVWNFVQYPEIPVFEVTQLENKADIRVKFSANGGNWSMVGIEAQTKVKDVKKPTLQLNLKGHSPELQESLVVHEFGHALGLEHEHQRSDFWDVLEKHLDIEKMKNDPRVNPSQSEEGRAAFGKDWFKQIDKPEVRTVNSLSEYDPMSIMHYWFDTNWIKEVTLRTYENIDRDLRLDPKEKQYLKGLHERSQKGQLTRRPSLRDYKVLVEAYGGKFVESQALVDILHAPDKAKQAASTDSVLRVNTHLKHIRNAVWDMQAGWRRLGGELELTTGTLDAIDIDRHNSGDKLGAVLERWMYTGKAKIHDLLNALESAPVGRPDIAKQILKYEGTGDAVKYGFPG